MRIDECHQNVTSTRATTILVLTNPTKMDLVLSICALAPAVVRIRHTVAVAPHSATGLHRSVCPGAPCDSSLSGPTQPID